MIISSRWIFFGSPYNNYLARIPKRLRFASHQKSSAGVRFCHCGVSLYNVFILRNFPNIIALDFFTILFRSPWAFSTTQSPRKPRFEEIS